MRHIWAGAVTVALSLLFITSAAATPGRMLAVGCHPLAADAEGTGLFVADPDGYDVVRLMASSWTQYYPSDPSCIAQPDWSPDGGRVVLQYECQLAVWDLANLLPRPWGYWFGECAPDVCCCPWLGNINPDPVPINSCGWGPKWSPAGDRIAFSDGSICVINPDGSDYRSLAPGGWDALTWTADGTGIVFADNGMWGDLYLVDDLDAPGGPSVTQLTDTPAVNEHQAAMSPDGARLAYSAGAAVPEGWDPLADPLPSAGVRVADWPGLTAVDALTDDPDYHDYVAAWDPEGIYVYFMREPAGDPQERPVSRQLWRVQADGLAPAEPVPGLAGWDQLWGGVTFMKEGVYGTSTYALPDYTEVPVSVGVVGVENLAGLQTELAFRMYSDWFPNCCPVIETMDSCDLGEMINHWSIVGPVIDQNKGEVRVLAYGANPETDRVSGVGALLNLAASIYMYDEMGFGDGVAPVRFAALELGDDWGEPIAMEAVPGGIALKPFARLLLSDVPGLTLGDENDPEPVPLTITALGDGDELLGYLSTEVNLYLETPTTDEWGRTWLWRHSDAISPATVGLSGGVWEGEVSLLEPAPEASRIVAKRGDFGGWTNAFYGVGKGDVSGDGVINVFDVIKIANIAIGRGTWEDWQVWAADFNGDGEVNIFDVVECAAAAMEAMEVSAVGPAASVMAAARVEAPELVEVSTSTSDGEGEALVAVNLSDCAGLAGIQVDLRYDPRRLAHPTASPGALLDGRGDWVVLGNDLDGLVRAIAYTPSMDVLSGGEGAILVFTFEKLGKQAGKMTLDSVVLSTQDATEIAAVVAKGGKDKDKKKDR